MSSFFYLTTTLPYINAEPHIGFGLEIVAGDVIARWQRLQNKKVIFNTGTDEHGQKIYDIAQQLKISPQKYSDQQSQKFYQLKNLLNLTFTNFIRTTDQKHQKAVCYFWQLVKNNAFFYKKNYKIKYCVGCELEKKDSELNNGFCPLHPNKALIIIDEKNYFFKFSSFQNKLLEIYQQQPTFVQPKSKMKEIISFVKNGLIDFSVSRLKEKMPWGIEVPNNQSQVIYVWFDALINYLSTLNWPEDKENFNNFWPVIQLAGKDNLRQQASMWQAMLLAANLPISQQILINGFISINGQKMSKSLNNVISPADMIGRYGQEASRFLLINLGVFGEDIDVSWLRFDTEYQTNLVNCLGNLCSRLAKMAQNCQLQINHCQFKYWPTYVKQLNHFQLTQALKFTLIKAKIIDRFLSEKKPWLLTNPKKQKILKQAIEKLLFVAYHLEPFMPKTKEFIFNHFYQKPIQTITKPLFPRLNKK